MVGAVTITLTDGAQIMIARVLVTMLSLSMPSAVFGEALHEQPRTPEQERALHEHEEEYEEAVRDAARRVGNELDPEVEPERSSPATRRRSGSASGQSRSCATEGIASPTT